MPGTGPDKIREKASMVLVRPVGDAWPEVTVSSSQENQDNDMRTCEVGMELEACKPNEICATANDKSRFGLCRCGPGFVSKNGGCEKGKTFLSC